MTTIQTAYSTFTLTSPDSRFTTTLNSSQLEAGLELLEITISAQEPAIPPTIILSWIQPIVDIHAYWRTAGDHDRSIAPHWGQREGSSKATSQAPVACLHSYSGQNRLTFALSDALHAIKFGAGVHEESATLHCSIQFFVEPSPPLSSYQATLRIDTRNIPYYESLREVQSWWAAQPGYEPAPVPEVARLPMYSTWYSFHQQLSPEGIEAECRVAKELGCEAVIVDDGWQTSNNERGYAYTGDWEVTEEKIPDMRAHVARVHELGLKYVLWYSVPFVGVHSKAYARFKDQFLYTIEFLGAGVLDPRYPEVREFIIATYERGLRDWDLDGFKLDFVDTFHLPQAGPAHFPAPPTTNSANVNELLPGQDYLSVPEAVDRLLTDIIARLRLLKPEILIEFRQAYIGPLMRKYGNMFRAADCPNDSLTNRERTLDIRLLCGNTAAHADMLMWHPDEPVESAALQIINILFSVPQVSVLLERLPTEHLEMTRFWLAFWREQRDVLLDGELQPLHPETLYPLVLASTQQKRIAVMYQESVVNPGPAVPELLLLVNGTRTDGMIVDLPEDLGQGQLEIRNCRGHLLKQEERAFTAGLHRLAIPASGLASFHKTA